MQEKEGKLLLLNSLHLQNRGNDTYCFQVQKGYAPAIKGIQTIAGDVATALVTENEIKELEKMKTSLL